MIHIDGLVKTRVRGRVRERKNERKEKGRQVELRFVNIRKKVRLKKYGSD